MEAPKQQKQQDPFIIPTIIAAVLILFLCSGLITVLTSIAIVLVWYYLCPYDYDFCYNYRNALIRTILILVVIVLWILIYKLLRLIIYVITRKFQHHPEEKQVLHTVHIEKQ